MYKNLIMRNKQVILAIILVILGLGWALFRDFQNSKNTTSPESITDFVNRSFVENRDVPLGEQENHESRVTNQDENQNQKTKEVLSDSTNLGELCSGEKISDFYCYEEYYSEVVRKEGIKPAFDDLREQYNKNSYIVSQCHPLTHVIGRIAAEKFGDVAEAYTQGDAFCWSGYYHGVLEGIIGRIGYKNLKSQMDGICKTLATQRAYSFDHYNCVHGLGHGVMAINQNELFDSLTMCDSLSDHWERQSCWSGAFMENVIVDNKDHFTKYLKPSDPVYPCNAVGDDYKATCYLMQTSYMLKVLGGNYSKVFEICSTVSEQHRATCYQSLGRDISGRSSSNAAATKAGCELGRDSEQRSNCVIGAVKDFISYYHSDQQAKELCASFEEKELRDLCSQTAESYYQLF